MRNVLLLVLVLVVAGCVTQEDAVEQLPTTCPPVCGGGTGGVETVINYPSEGSNVYAAERFAPSFYLADVGESNAEGLVCVTGLDGDIFSGLGGCNCQDFYIVLDEPDDPNFEETYITYQSASVDSGRTLDQSMTVYTRYLYSTFGVFELCLTGDPFAEEECSTTGEKLQGSSGGPVQVTSVTEELTKVGSNAVTVRVVVEAQVAADANEKLIELEDTTNIDCVLPTDEDARTKVNMDIVLLGARHECSPLFFREGEDTATSTCKIENLDTQLFIGGEKEYQGYVEIQYGFQNIQSVGFTVVSE